MEHLAGYDIRFTDSSGTAVLDFQIESYDPINGELNVWVRIPQLTGGQDYYLDFQFGNSSIVSDNSSSNVWDGNYQGVWHLNDQFGDATNNGNNGINRGSSASTGQLGPGRSFDGSNDWIEVPHSSSLNITGNQITLQAWVKAPIPNDDDSPFLVKGPGMNQEQYMLGVDGTGSNSSGNPITANVNSRVTTNTGHYRDDAAQIPDDAWTHVVFVYDGNLSSNPRKLIYLNGQLAASHSASGNLISSTSSLHIAKRLPGDNRYFEGDLDELRISDVVRSPDWIQTEFNNQSDPAAWYELIKKAEVGDLRYTLEIDGNQLCGSGTYSNFVVLTDISDLNLRHESMGGYVSSWRGWDFQFKDSSNELYNFQIESYDPVNGRLIAWVEFPQLQAGQDYTYFLEFGGTDTTSDPSDSEIWSARYSAIYHFEDLEDATGNNNDGSNNGSVSGNGLIGSGRNFDGNNDYIQVNNSSSVDISGDQISISLWFNADNNSNDPAFVIKGNSTNQEQYMLGIDNPTSSNTLNHRVTTNTGHYRDNQFAITNGRWYMVTFVYDANQGNPRKRLYVDGQLVATANASGDLISTNAPMLIGRRVFGDNRFFDGSLDELRLYNEALGADEICAEYNNQSGGLVSLGDMEFTEGSALPVEWLYADAEKVSESEGLINWATSLEINNEGFEVQRSADGQDFEVVGFVPGAGNSTEIQEYKFVDSNPKAGLNFYRIKQIDFDGKVDYSRVLKLNFEVDEMVEVSISPNPANSQTRLTLEGTVEGVVDVEIMEITGRLVHRSSFNAAEQQTQIQPLPGLESLPPGTYLVRVLIDGSFIGLEKLMIN